MAEDWLEDVKKYATNVDETAVAGIVRYCGIALRNRDSSLVSFSDPTETDRVRENFLKKKLALTDPDETLDGAIAAVGQRMKEDRTKNRVTVYYLLAEHFGKLGLFNGGGAVDDATGAEPTGIGGPAGVAAAGAAGLAALGGATEAASASGVDETPPAGGGIGTGGTPSGGDGFGGGASGGGSTGGARPLADLPDDGDGGSILGKWWLWLLLALAILAAFLLLKSCMNPQPVTGPIVVNTIDTNLTDDQSGNLSDSDIGNTVTAVPAAPVVAPAGAGIVTETRAGLPMLTTYFDTGKAALADGFADKAADVKAYVAAHPGAKLAVSGYNDPTGNAAVNAELSKKRAQVVAAALKAAGIAEDAVVLEKPADTTIANADPAAARRVEVTVKQ